MRSDKTVKKFVNRADKYTDMIAFAVSEKLQSQGVRPYFVIAGINRSQIDFNRPPNQAYEDDRAQQCYSFYHHKIRQAIADIRYRWGQGFLLDIHGQSKFSDDIIRGTRNKQTNNGIDQPLWY